MRFESELRVPNSTDDREVANLERSYPLCRYRHLGLQAHDLPNVAFLYAHEEQMLQKLGKLSGVFGLTPVKLYLAILPTIRASESRAAVISNHLGESINVVSKAIDGIFYPLHALNIIVAAMAMKLLNLIGQLPVINKLRDSALLKDIGSDLVVVIGVLLQLMLTAYTASKVFSSSRSDQLGLQIHALALVNSCLMEIMIRGKSLETASRRIVNCRSVKDMTQNVSHFFSRQVVPRIKSATPAAIRSFDYQSLVRLYAASLAMLEKAERLMPHPVLMIICLVAAKTLVQTLAPDSFLSSTQLTRR